MIRAASPSNPAAHYASSSRSNPTSSPSASLPTPLPPVASSSLPPTSAPSATPSSSDTFPAPTSSASTPLSPSPPTLVILFPAIALYFEMLVSGFVPNTYTFPPLKHGATAVSPVGNALLHIYASCGLVYQDRVMFYKTSNDKPWITYYIGQTMIRGKRRSYKTSMQLDFVGICWLVTIICI